MALSKSLPTPKTQELLRVVTSVAVGAPEEALVLFVAPMAPEPPVPVVSAPVKVTTVSDETTLCESAAVTVMLLSVDGAKARQISDVPLCLLERRTSVHVKPPPVTLVTVVLDPEEKSVATNAKRSSLAAVVENAEVATEDFAVD